MAPSLISRRLDALFEDSTGMLEVDPYQAAQNIMGQLEDARRHVSDLEQQLLYATDRLCGGLAVNVRRRQPGLNVGLDHGHCRVGYRSKALLLRPDLTNKVWAVDSGDPAFARKFQRLGAMHLGLTNDLTTLAAALAQYFMNHYKSLGEEIRGEGIVLHDGRQVTLGQLIEVVNENDRLLREGFKR
jgi:hypothetical protein